MKFLNLKTTDPYRNLAIEEYLFLHSEEDVLMLWQNESTVVIGKNQNVYAELALDVIRERGVHVARRITGGGAVYHDLGNVNFSLISTTKGRDGLDFAAFCAPMIEALSTLGVRAELSGRNDLLVDGKKISGNAQHASGDRVLHHGTLLFDSDLEALSAVLRVDEEKLRAKAVRSVRSRVTNIRPYLGADCGVSEFIERLGQSLCRVLGATPMMLPRDEEIERLCVRNASDEWLFPDRALLSQYSLIKKKRYPFGTVEVLLDMHHEIVQSVCIRGDFFGTRPISELEACLQGATIHDLSDRLLGVDVGAYIFGMRAEELISQLRL